MANITLNPLTYWFTGLLWDNTNVVRVGASADGAGYGAEYSLVQISQYMTPDVVIARMAAGLPASVPSLETGINIDVYENATSVIPVSSTAYVYSPSGAVTNYYFTSLPVNGTLMVGGSPAALNTAVVRSSLNA